MRVQRDVNGGIVWFGGFVLFVAFGTAMPAEGADQNQSTSQLPATAQGDAALSKSSAQAKPGEKKLVKYIRVRRDKNQQPTALETAVTRYVTPPGQEPSVVVDLVGAVHIGERVYYEQLNQRFRNYDAVLYELVAAEGARVEPGRQKRNHPVNMLQNVMKDVLKLDYQLDHIDYSAANLVHADMSPTEFSKSMEDRGESFLKMFLRAMGQAMSMQAGSEDMPSDLELLVALVARDRDYRLKKLMAQQFEHMDAQLDVISGPDGSTIITERNKTALGVLRKQISMGKKRLAIFYGAGHLSDMAERLEKEFGLRREKQEWLEAWKITPPTAGTSGGDQPLDAEVLEVVPADS